MKGERRKAKGLSFSGRSVENDENSSSRQGFTSGFLPGALRVNANLFRTDLCREPSRSHGWQLQNLLTVFSCIHRSHAPALIVIHIFRWFPNLQSGNQRKGFLRKLLIAGVQASPASASKACTPVAISRLQYVTMDIGLHRSGDGSGILTGMTEFRRHLCIKTSAPAWECSLGHSSVH